MAAKKSAKKATKEDTKTSSPPSRPARFRPFIASLRTRTAFRLFAVWLGAYLILVSFFFHSIMNNFSYVEVFPNEIVLPMLMHALTALIIALGLYWIPWIKMFSGKLIAGLMLALLVVGYDSNLQAVSGIIRGFVPGLTDSDSMPLVSIIYLVLLFALAVGIGIGAEYLIRKVKRIQPRDVELGILALVAYIFLVPAFSVAKIMPAMIQETRVQAPEFTKQGQNQTAKAADKPDIYYIVLDRYTNATTLKNQFAFDNSPFTGFLRANDFHVNDKAYANYPYTTMSISSTINSMYTNELVAPFKNDAVQSRALYHNLIRQSSVVKALKKEGYHYYSIGSAYGASYKAPLAERDYMWSSKLTIFGHNKRLRGVEGLEFAKSPYYHFTQLSGVKWWPLKLENRDPVAYLRTQLTTLDDLSTTEKPGGRFIFAHMLIPHDPFYFNADGSLSTTTATDSVGKPIKQKYTDQVSFINTQIKELVSNIQRQTNGKAVVVLNSDEGPYPQFLNDTFKKPQASDQAAIDAVSTGEDMRRWPDDYFNMKYGVLQAVHIPKATDADMQHLSSANIFRIILNRYLGYKLDYLPECHYGLIDGSKSEFNYVDVTNKFVTRPDASCAQRQSLPSKR